MTFMPGHEGLLSAEGAMPFPLHPSCWGPRALDKEACSLGQRREPFPGPAAAQGWPITGTGHSPRPLWGSRFSFLNLLSTSNHSFSSSPILQFSPPPSPLKITP